AWRSGPDQPLGQARRDCVSCRLSGRCRCGICDRTVCDGEWWQTFPLKQSGRTVMTARSSTFSLLVTGTLGTLLAAALVCAQQTQAHPAGQPAAPPAQEQPSSPPATPPAVSQPPAAPAQEQPSSPPTAPPAASQPSAAPQTATPAPPMQP